MMVEGKLEQVDSGRVRLRLPTAPWPKGYPVTEPVERMARALVGEDVVLDLDQWGVGVALTPARSH